MVGEEHLTDLSAQAQVTRDFVTALGILVAGGWSFYVFGLGRSFAPNVQVQVALRQVIDSADGKVAVVSVTVKNSGRTDVRKETCFVNYKLTSESPPTYRALAELESLNTRVDSLIPGVKRKVMFKDLEGLEPGEEHAEELVVYLGQSVVFKVAGSFQTRPKIASIRIWWQNLGEKFWRPRSGKTRKVRKVRDVNSEETFDIRSFKKKDQPATNTDHETSTAS